MKIKSLFLYLIILFSSLSFAQETFILMGKITDENEKPIARSKVSILDTSTTTFSNETGDFQLPINVDLPINIIVEISGYETKIVLYDGTETFLTIPLELIDPTEKLEEITITARRRNERTQDVPIAVTVLNGNQVEDAGAFNVNRVKELVPTVQLYSSNPRNTTLNIRGLGSTFGLTNDGIDPGVGFYVDGVYYARPAATTLDFIDIEQIEVLRGPQGTLFGKNTTAGAFNITTKKPTFEKDIKAELSYGNYGFIQAKTSVSGKIVEKIAGRLSFSGTQRDGLLYNVRTDKHVNDLNNLGIRGQLLFEANDRLKFTLIGDATWQRPDGFAQVYAGAVKTKRADYRQFSAIIADLGYTLPSTNPFDRIIDHDTPWRSNNDLGGISFNVDAKIGQGTLTSTTAWRYWNWNPSNDRDFTGLAMLAKSQAPSTHNQYSQEVRYAGDLTQNLSGVFGVYAIYQNLKSDPFHTEEAGADQWRFSQNSTSELWQTPGLLEGYGIRTYSELNSFSGAVFAQFDWKLFDKLHILPGIRLNYDQKDLTYRRETYGGLQTEDPDLLAIKNAVYSNQAFSADVDDVNVSGQLSAAYHFNQNLNVYATFATGYKPVGLNLGGLPSSDGQPLTEYAQIKPEDVQHFEIGIKSSPWKRTIVNISAFLTNIDDYQTLVQTAELGVNRGFLANAEQVRVMGIELDARTRINRNLSFFGNLAYTDARYEKFTNAPVPLEETGSEISFKDISGGKLPGVSEWAGSVGGEASTQGSLIGFEGDYFFALESFFRSEFSSSPSPSQFLNIPGYGIFNGRIGFRASDQFTLFIWGRNLLDKNYFEQLLPGAGNAGHYAAVLGDQRTYGVTFRFSFN